MADKTAIDSDDDMTTVLAFSRGRRVRHRVLLAVLPAGIACLWIKGVKLAPAVFNTVGAEYYILSCYVALFLAFAFPFVLPELSDVARRSYSLACTIGVLLLLNYCTGKRPPLTSQIDELNQYLLPNTTLLVCVILWLLIVYYRYRQERPLPSNTTSGGLVLLVVAWMGFMILDPVWRQARPKSNMISCISNLKQLELGVLMYAQDWDQKLPPARQWATLADKYVHNSSIYHCPSAVSSYSYASNRALSGISLEYVTAPAETVQLFESNAVLVNASGGLEALAKAGRHTGGLNFGFLDGHVKWMSRDSVGRLTWLPTFETRSPGSSSSPAIHSGKSK